MVSNTFPVNQARPLIEMPNEIPQIGFLGGEGGKEINDSIRTDYKNFPALQVGKYSDGVVKGSNIPYVIAVQSKLPAGVRVATQSDLEKSMKVGALSLDGTYEDTSLVLRDEGNPNSYLASNLMAQVKARLGKKAKMPVMVPLYGLGIVKDQDSPNGLAFKLNEDAEIVYAPILNKGGNFNSEDINDKTGLPTKLGKGNRTLYTRDSGLSGLFLNRGLYLYSNGDGLAGSNGDGRVVLVSPTAEGGSQALFNEKLSELGKVRDAKIVQIKDNYKKAEIIMRKGLK